MMTTRATCPLLALLFVVAGCGTAPAASDAGGAPCDGSAACHDEGPPESVCLERLAADELVDGCGVFVTNEFGGGDDANPGTTKDKPVRTLQRAVELARTGRGRVFVCADGFYGPLVLPSGVDLLGGFHCFQWQRQAGSKSQLYITDKPDFTLTVVPAAAEDTGAADGVSRIVDMGLSSFGPITMLVQSNTEVEILRGWIRSSYGWGGHAGEDLPEPSRAPDGADGMYGGNACSAETVAGGPAVVNPCQGGMPSVGGKGGDGLPGGAEDGRDGEPTPTPNPSNYGRRGRGDVADVGCTDGDYGIYGARGTVGAPGQGIGRISEAGWEADWAGDGGWGTPGQGGGGGGGRRGGLGVCGAASRGGAGGGSGGAGGCGGRGGKGGENGSPSIGIVALHARVTVRDSEIQTSDGGQGGDGGEPQRGGRGGRGAPGGVLEDRSAYSCNGGPGGDGAEGGYGGPGRGGDSIGIAYLDEDRLTALGVTFTLGPPGKGGISWDDQGKMISGEDGVAVETRRFPE
ncbi:hypothetical protein WMF38_49285 [Sorangium sp. So ce118]